MKFNSHQPKIIVIGSCSIDLVLRTEKTPEKGETLMAIQAENYFGGKGANEAVAVSRLGANSYFVGCIGMDSMGHQIMHHLVDEGVNVGYLSETESQPTGSAYITASKLENTIVVDPAANSHLHPKHIAKVEKYFDTTDFILLQLEISMEAVEYAIQLAKKHHVKIGLYASPAKKLSLEVLQKVDFIVVKKQDVEIVFGEKLNDDLLQRYADKLLVREQNKTTLYNGNEVKSYEDNSLPILHKMGMGDAFTAGVAIALCHGNTIGDAVQFGNKISLKVSQEKGSQKGLPYLKEIKKLK